MLSSKFYLYKTEWLDLVFDHRNKEYGAYDLRRHYADNLVKAMGIAFFSVVTLFIAYSFLHNSHHASPVITAVPQERTIQIKIDHLIQHPKASAGIKPPPPKPAVKYTEMVAVPDHQAQKPVTLEQLSTKRIGAEDVQGKDDGTIDIPELDKSDGSGTGTDPKINNDPVGTDVLEVMPEPYGGAAAWSKFLEKNMRYPQQAVDAEKEGKVWISFIIEKDGRLSNIVVERGAGFGMDEEALRVLKLAPAWKPGIQNGRPVRVKYNIPINFQLAGQ